LADAGFYEDRDGARGEGRTLRAGRAVNLAGVAAMAVRAPRACMTTDAGFEAGGASRSAIATRAPSFLVIVPTGAEKKSVIVLVVGANGARQAISPQLRCTSNYTDPLATAPPTEAPRARPGHAVHRATRSRIASLARAPGRGPRDRRAHPRRRL
jgi:hypothetical protein